MDDTPDPRSQAVWVTVDHLDGHHALVELPDGSTVPWPLASLPRGVQDGDVVRLTVIGGDLDLEIDRAETEMRRVQAQQALDALNADGPHGDLDL